MWRGCKARSCCCHRSIHTCFRHKPCCSRHQRPWCLEYSRCFHSSLSYTISTWSISIAKKERLTFAAVLGSKVGEASALRGAQLQGHGIVSICCTIQGAPGDLGVTAQAGVGRNGGLWSQCCSGSCGRHVKLDPVASTAVLCRISGASHITIRECCIRACRVERVAAVTCLVVSFL